VILIKSYTLYVLVYYEQEGIWKQEDYCVIYKYMHDDVPTIPTLIEREQVRRKDSLNDQR